MDLIPWVLDQMMTLTDHTNTFPTETEEDGGQLVQELPVFLSDNE